MIFNLGNKKHDVISKLSRDQNEMKRKRNTERGIKFMRIVIRIIGGLLASYVLFRYNYDYGVSSAD